MTLFDLRLSVVLATVFTVDTVRPCLCSVLQSDWNAVESDVMSQFSMDIFCDFFFTYFSYRITCCHVVFRKKKIFSDVSLLTCVSVD